MVFGAILAGGKGTRMGIDKPKQFLMLGSRPIIIHTIEKFILSPDIDEIYVGVHPDWIDYTEDLIKKYIDSKYPTLRKKTIYIAYGTNKVDLSDINEKGVLEEYGLKKDNYLLMVGRFVPENNFELVINEFIKSNINKNLVIISNLSSSNYYNEIISKTNCLTDKRIIFINGVYDEKKLSTIRKNAYAYIHGHSVGGTNPSLLEALSLTKLNILYDVNFNKDVGKESCLYFKKDGSLTKILDNINNYDRKKMGKEAKKIIEENFTWQIIVDKYKNIFRK